MKVYDGVPAAPGRPAQVLVTEGGSVLPLAIRSEVRCFAPAIAWGDGKPATRQLAFAILFDALGDKQRAIALSERFRDHLFASLPAAEPWSLSRQQIERLADSFESYRLRDIAGGVAQVATIEGRF